MEGLTHIAIAGANGRMGKELLRAGIETDGIVLSAALVRAESPYLGKNAGLLADLKTIELLCTSQDLPLSDNTDVLIDFTLPDNTLLNLQRCVEAKKALVIGTTGFTEQQQSLINQAAQQIPILQASNTSIGVNLTHALLKQVATVLGDKVNIEIIDTHHIHKKDSPSGTAITMAEVIAKAVNKDVSDCVSITSIREGEVVGDHRVIFNMDDEQIEIIHRAGNRQIFAKGAIKAASWLSGKKPGLYSMADVLGI